MTNTVNPASPEAHRFHPLDQERVAPWDSFLNWNVTFFPMLVGCRVEEIRQDYCRLRLPYRSELDQPAGVVHGGAIATLIDTVVVPAIAAVYEDRRALFTISMTIDYLSAVDGVDAIAEGWVEKRGRSVVFCRAAVRTPDGMLAATASLVYKLGRPFDPPS